MENILHDIVPALAVAVAYTILFVGVELWSRRRNPDRELTRKTVHIAAGLIALPFPWIFSTHWTVLILGAVFMSILLITRRTGHLASVQSVGRSTIGEILYPVAICITLVLSQISGGAAVYLVSVGTLAFADSLAGLLGKRYGRHLYRLNGAVKSYEGSAVFLLIACTIIVAGMLSPIAADIGLRLPVAASLTAAVAATVIEAISPNGIDNITVPLGVSGVLALWIAA